MQEELVIFPTFFATCSWILWVIANSLRRYRTAKLQASAGGAIPRGTKKAREIRSPSARRRPALVESAVTLPRCRLGPRSTPDHTGDKGRLSRHRPRRHLVRFHSVGGPRLDCQVGALRGPTICRKPLLGHAGSSSGSWDDHLYPRQFLVRATDLALLLLEDGYLVFFSVLSAYSVVK